MSNETLEFTRVMLYLFGAYGMLYAGVSVPALRLTAYAIAGYFLMWMGLLLYQSADALNYRVVSNYISTPGLAIIVMVIYVNLAFLRTK